MQDRPTAAELLEAIRTFLTDDVAEELSGRRRFHLRVAINMLGVVGRELEHERAALRSEWALLAPLTGRPDRPPSDGLPEAVRSMNVDLAAAIRAGDLDDRWDQTLDAVRTVVRDKLRIANPGYAEEDGGNNDGPSSVS